MKKILFLIPLLSITFLTTSYTNFAPQVSPLFEAAQQGNVEKLTEWKKANIDLSITDEKGNSLLHIAAMHGQNHAIEVLSQPREYAWYQYNPLSVVYRWYTQTALPSLNATNKNGDTPLHCAIQCDQEDTVRLLLEKKANQQIKNNQNLTPFLTAIKTGHYTIFGLFLSDGIDVLECDVDANKNVLTYAIDQNKPAIVKQLAYHPQLQKFFDKDGLNALYYAITQNKSECVGALAQHSQLRDTFGKDGLNALGYAIKQNKRECIHILAQHPQLRDSLDRNGFAAIHYSAQLKDKELFATLKQNGADVNKKDAFDKAPLNYAYDDNDRDWKRFLTKEANVDLNIKDKKGRTELYKATASGNIHKVKELLEDGLDPNTSNNKRKTPLHRAAKNGSMAIVDAFLEHGVEVGNRTSEGLNEFALALEGEHIEIAKKLQSKSNIHTIDNFGKNVLLRAVWNNKPKSVDYALKIGIDATRVSSKKNSVLHAVAWTGNESILNQLLKIGSVLSLINKSNEEGKTPLHNAATQGNSKVTEILLHHGAQPRIADWAGHTPAHNAALKNNSAVARLIRHYDSASMTDMDKQGNSPLNLAIISKHQACIPELIHPDNINHVNNAGYAPLHLGALHNVPLASIKHLIEKGAKPLMTDNAGNNCLHLSIEYAEQEHQAFFARYDSLLNQKNCQGIAPLHTAVIGTKLRSVALLLANKLVHIDIQTNTGNTSLALAASAGSLPLVGLLIEGNANLNLKNANGYTPLALASYNGHLNCIQRLESARALNYECTNLGQNYLHIAAAQGHMDVVNHYIRSNFPRDMRDNNHNTEFRLACLNGHTEIAKKLYNKDERDHANGDISWLLANMPRNHYTTLSFLKDTQRNRTAACQAVYNKQGTILGLAHENKNVFIQAKIEYGSDIHAYKPSKYERYSQVPLATMLEWTATKRQEFDLWLDSFYKKEIEQKTLLNTTIAYKKKEKDNECQEAFTLHNEVLSGINAVQRNITELTRIRRIMPELVAHEYNPCDLECTDFYTKEKVASLNPSARKQYIRDLIQCKNYVAQEKIKTDLHLKQAQDRLKAKELEERRKQEAEIRRLEAEINTLQQTATPRPTPPAQAPTPPLPAISKEDLKQKENECAHILNMHYTITNLIDAVKKNQTELDKMRNTLTDLEAYVYKPSKCECSSFYTQEKVESLDASGRKAYIRDLLNCQGYIGQEKTKTESRIKQAKEKIEKLEEQKKQLAEQAAKPAFQVPPQGPPAPYAAPAQANAPQPSVPQQPAEPANPQDAPDRCYKCWAERDDSHLFRLPCSACKVQRVYVCADCVEELNIKAGQTKCPATCGGQKMTDFTVFEGQ